MSYIKADNDREQEHFDYLEDLRQSGRTNMWGARPFLQEAFELTEDEAGEVLLKWIKLHKDASRVVS